MNATQEAATREILAGMYEGIDYAYSQGREPSESLMAKIREMEDEIEAYTGPSCHCGSAFHGGDCMCNEY